MKQRNPFFFRTFSHKTRKTWLFLLLLILLMIVLISPGMENRSQVSLIEHPVVFVTTLFQEGTAAVTGGISGIWRGYVDLLSVREENERLQTEVARLREEQSLLQEEVLAAGRMRELLEIGRNFPEKAAAAQVIGRDPTNWYRTMVLDKGEEDGIALHGAVVSSRGVVGRVIKVYPHSSRVLLISDRSSSLAGMIQRNRVSGILQGEGGGHLSLEYVPLDESVILGDLVLTSGLEGIFPKGIPVGRVTRVDRKTSPLFLSIQVSPAVDPSKVEEVWVMKGKGP
jgi:rod shape-determining protein MreC